MSGRWVGWVGGWGLSASQRRSIDSVALATGEAVKFYGSPTPAPSDAGTSSTTTTSIDPAGRRDTVDEPLDSDPARLERPVDLILESS